MKTDIKRILFEFDPVCPKCDENHNEDGTDTTFQITVMDIQEVGWPICQICNEEMQIEDECEVRA